MTCLRHVNLLLRLRLSPEQCLSRRLLLYRGCRRLMHVVNQRLVERRRLLSPVIVWVFVDGFKAYDCLGVGDYHDRGRDYFILGMDFDASGLFH